MLTRNTIQSTIFLEHYETVQGLFNKQESYKTKDNEQNTICKWLKDKFMQYEEDTIVPSQQH